MVLDSIDLFYWKQASDHYCGQGVETGVHQISFQLYRKLAEPEHCVEHGVVGNYHGWSCLVPQSSCRHQP